MKVLFRTMIVLALLAGSTAAVAQVGFICACGPEWVSEGGLLRLLAQPTSLQAIPPPPAALAGELPARVQVDFDLTATGETKHLTIHAPDAVLAYVTAEVQRWKFRPYRWNGQAIDLPSHLEFCLSSTKGFSTEMIDCDLSVWFPRPKVKVVLAPAR